MVDAELGTKRSCPSCSSRFYDLNKDPIVCPSCSESFIVEPILPSKSDAASPAKPVEEEEKPKKDDDVEIVSLEDAEDDDDDADDDEAAAIKDVDLGEDVEIDSDGDDDAFLEEEDDDDTPAIGIIGTAKPDDSDS